jgi:hypothetical protein
MNVNGSRGDLVVKQTNGSRDTPWSNYKVYNVFGAIGPRISVTMAPKTV